jgi:hypothetical protein
LDEEGGEREEEEDERTEEQRREEAVSQFDLQPSGNSKIKIPILSLQPIHIAYFFKVQLMRRLITTVLLDVTNREFERIAGQTIMANVKSKGRTSSEQFIIPIGHMTRRNLGRG